MKKAFSYMVVGALTYACYDAYMNRRSEFNKNLKKIKKSGCETINKVKSMF